MLGRVDDAHPYASWLLAHRADPADLAWHREHPVGLDVLGVNFYAGLSCWRFSAASGRTVRRRVRGTADHFADVLEAWWSRYQQPLMVTETSDEGTPARRVRWLDASVAVVRDARRRGVEVRGYTWFPVLSHVRWDWRRGRLPTDAYWTHMGLWDLHADDDGVLRRVETPVAAAFTARVAAGEP